MRILEFSDWLLLSNTELTEAYSEEELENHCNCPWCRNFYQTVDVYYPDLRYFLSRFGLKLEAPESLLPITKDLYQASYVVEGRIIRKGTEPIFVNDLPIMPEQEPETESFILNIGLMKLPWVLDEDQDSVSPPVGVLEYFIELNRS